MIDSSPPSADERKALQTEIDTAMMAYYQNYYQDMLGLLDWNLRVENRLREEEELGTARVERVEEWRNMSFDGLKVLVVGAGTGAESIALHRRGAIVHGIEPDSEALAIINKKCVLHGMSNKNFHLAVGEQIPFVDETFDFVYCYTVLEHVQDVEQSIAEMVRVCKTGGEVFIQTPDYRFPYEGHYKSNRIPFSPKWMSHVQFWLQGKPVEFLKSINFLTAPMLDRIFMQFNVQTVRLIPSLIRNWTLNNYPYDLKFWFLETSGIARDQNIFLQKQG